MSELERVNEPEFIPMTDLQAMMVIEKRKKAIEEFETLEAYFKERIKRAKEETEERIANYDRSLRVFFDSVPHEKTKTQESVKLPGAKLVMKKQNPEYKRDDKTVIEWLKANGGDTYIKTKEELDWAGLKANTAVFDGQIVNGDGEIIPGIEVIEREPKFAVE